MRYSTDRQELKVQEDEIQKFIEYTFKNQEIEIIKYIDEGYSGKDMNRNNFKRMMEDIKSKKINTIIALKLDRISRSISDLLFTFKIFEENKVDVMIIKDKIDTTTAQGRLLFHILGAFAEFERESIRERLQAGRKYAETHGSKSGKPLHRPRKEINIRKCIEYHKAGLSLNKLGKMFEVSPITIRNRLIEEGVYEKLMEVNKK